MERRTYAELLQEVKYELSLSEETIIEANEFVQYCNDSIHEAESVINMLRKDYFLTEAQIKNSAESFGLVSGRADYPMPDDMHALKIREIVYNNGTMINEIKPFRRNHRLANIAMANNNNSLQQGNYEYLIMNKSVYDPENPYTTGPMIKLIPTPLENGDYITIYYLRSATKVPYTNNTDTQIDIPEFYDFVKAAFRMKCAVKEGVPDFQAHVEMYALLKKEMIKNLRNKVDDDNDLIPMDVSSYVEFAGGTISGMDILRR